MARTELPYGVILPAEYSDDWYEDMTSNLTKLDNVIGSDSEKLNADSVDFLRMSSAALTDGGTGNFSDLNSSYKIKTGDLILDSGRKLYQVVSVDSTNETFTVGNSLFKITAESDLAHVAESGDYDDLDNKPDLNPYDQHIANTEIHVTTADKTKWNNNVTQSYVFRYSGTALVPNSTIAYSTIDNTDNIKSGDKILDVDGKLFEITAVDTTNQTVTVGSALIDLALDANVVHTNEINSSGIGIIGAVKEVGGVDFNTLTTQGLYGTNASGSTNNPENSPCVVQVIKRLNSVIQIANVSSSAYKSRYIRYCADITAQPPVWQSWIKFATDDNVMHLSGDETASGKKQLNTYLTLNGNATGDEFSNNARTCAYLTANMDTVGKSGVFVSKFRQNRAQGTMSGNDVVQVCFDVFENEVRTNRMWYLSWLDWNNDAPETVEIRSFCNKVDYKLTHINDLEPSALGMPDLNNGVDISGYITVNGGNKESLYTPPANGWISVALSRTGDANMAVMLKQGNFASSGHNIAQENGTTTCNAMLPVKGGVQVSINSALADGIAFAYFYPCQGNV